MVWLPASRADVLKVAVPPLSVPVPRELDPSLKVTDPVGVPAPGATAPTVAVKVTDWPKVEGLGAAESAVVVLAWLTVCITAPEVLVRKLLSPPQAAVM